MYLLKITATADIDPKAEPSPAALQIVQQALESSSAQKSDAVPLLDKAINTWKSEKLPDDELAGLYRLRADARNRFGDSDKAEADLSEVVRLLRGPGAAAADPAELPRALLFRARLEFARGAWASAREDAAAALALQRLRRKWLALPYAWRRSATRTELMRWILFDAAPEWATTERMHALRRAVRRRQTRAPPVLAHRAATHDRAVHRCAPPRRRPRPQQKRSHALRPHVPVRARVKRLAPPVHREHTLSLIHI